MNTGGSTEKNALLLCGGGSRGAIEVGFYRALGELKIPIDLVVGTSVGAINGAAIASGIDWKDLAKLWCRITAKDLFQWNWQIFFKGAKANSFYTHERLRRFLNQNLPARHFEDLKIPLFITGTDLETGRMVVFKEGDLSQAIMASISIPGVFPPVRYQGRWVIDGGVTGILPIKPAIDCGAKTIIAMRCECRVPSKHPPSGLRDILIRSFAIALEAKHETDLLLYESKVKVIALEPCFDVEVDFLDFSRSAELIEMSYQFSKKELEKFFPVKKPSQEGVLQYCFCEIPESELLLLAKQKFIQGRPTEELMKKARSEKEKGYIATIALMDLGEEDLKKFIRRGAKDISHVFACRDRVVAALKEHGIECRRGVCQTEGKDKGIR